MSLANCDCFTFSSNVYAFFLVFLITMLTTSSTMLNKSIKCLVSHLGRNTLSISPSNMMLAVGLSYVTVMILRYVNSNYFAESLYHKWMFFFFKMLFLHLDGRISNHIYSLLC